MKLLDALRSQIFRYIGDDISLKTLREWLAPLSLDVESSGEPDAIRVVYAMVGDLADFDEGFLPESQLRQNFANLLFTSPIASHYQQIPVSRGFSSPVVTGTLSQVEPSEGIGTGRALEYA